MDRGAVEKWVEDYERLWRMAGTDQLAELFTPDASYLPSPWAQPIAGLEAIARFWEAEREGPAEEFTMTSGRTDRGRPGPGQLWRSRQPSVA
jgi:ketosteroid isomerase-like protein